MPQSTLAPSASEPTPLRRRAVIAATIGFIAGTSGLVLLGVGVAAATTGPSTGAAAAPAPFAPATSSPEPATEVDMGVPPVPSVLMITDSPVGLLAATSAANAALVAQEAPLTVGADVASAGPVVAARAEPADLPDTGNGDRSIVLVAWLTVLTGGAFIALRRVPQRRQQVVVTRPVRRAARHR